MLWHWKLVSWLLIFVISLNYKAEAQIPTQDDLPSERDATPAPTEQQSTGMPSLAEPVLFPSNPPTERPTTASITIILSGKPSPPFTESSTAPSARSTIRQDQQTLSTIVTVPFQFNATVESNNLDTLTTLEDIWGDFVKDSLEGDGLQVFGVDLVVSIMDKTTTSRALQDGTMDLQVNGIVDVNNVGMSDNQLRDQIMAVLDRSLTAEALQASLVDAGISDVSITSIEKEEYTALESDEKDDGPELWEIVVGFTIAGLGFVMCMFWMGVLYHKRQRRRRKRKLETVRKLQSYVVAQPERARQGQPPAPVVTPYSSPPRLHTPSLSPIRPAQKSPNSVDSPYRGIPDDEDVNAISDPFARELERAAIMDRLAWEDFQRKKIELHHRQQSEDGRVLERIGSFPYGDEGKSPKRRAVRAYQATTPVRDGQSVKEGIELTLDDQSQWSASRISRAPSTGIPLGGRIEGHFSPYGEENKSSFNEIDNELDLYGDGSKGKKPLTIQDRWDLDKNPVVDTGGPSQYSFVYPMQRQKISDVGGRSSPSSMPSEDNIAVRGSPTVTSLSTVDGSAGGTSSQQSESNFRASSVSYADTDKTSVARVSPSFLAVGPTPNEDRDILESDSSSRDDEDSLSPGLIQSMVGEVARLSMFVKNYEKQKTEARNSGLLNDANMVDDDSLSPDKTSRMMDVPQKPRIQDLRNPIHERDSKARFMEYKSTLAGHASISHDDSGDMDDDESSQFSQRLGIQRYSVQRPESPFKSDDLSAIHSLDASTTAGSVSVHGPAIEEGARAPTPPRKIKEKQSVQLDAATKGTTSSRLPVRNHKLQQTQAANKNKESEEVLNSRSQQTSLPPDKAIEPPKPKPSLVTTRPPKVRAKNEGFKNIVGMFESKPHTAAVPPERWQDLR